MKLKHLFEQDEAKQLLDYLVRYTLNKFSDLYYESIVYPQMRETNQYYIGGEPYSPSDPLKMYDVAIAHPELMLETLWWSSDITHKRFSLGIPEDWGTPDLVNELSKRFAGQLKLMRPKFVRMIKDTRRKAISLKRRREIT